MTFAEAVKAGHLRLRRDPWNEYAHIELMPIRDGYGPWVFLRDVGVPPDIPAEQKILSFEFPKDGWEPWEPPDDVERISVGWPNYSSVE